MTKEQTIEAIKVMQAFVDGKEVQVRRDGCCWETTKGPLWDFQQWDYRIKPQPREWWLHDHCGGNSFLTAHPSKECWQNCKPIHVREVEES